MFPLAALIYVFTFVATNRLSYHSDFNEFIFSALTTWLTVALYWFLLWRSSVIWNPRRKIGTLLGVIGAILVGALGGSIAEGLIRYADGFGAFFGGVLTITVWLIVTVFLWRDTRAERAERVKKSNRSAIVCPTCGYNLTGLSECRCPECGSTFTLDELMALQPSADAEIE